MKVLDAEKITGIETFFTNSKGCGGKLRTDPEDFFVKEISNYPPKNEKGKFTIADVTSTNWETNRLIREISNRVHISRKRIGFAGTKDKRAKTVQLMSFYKTPIQDLQSINIKDVSIENIYKSDRPVKIGNLQGNSFEINIKNIESETSLEDIKKIAKKLIDTAGFPNFFGIQRFGIQRPITHIVGKYIVNGDFKKAVMTYVANPIEGEGEETFQFRKNLKETNDFAEALKSYPNYLNFEKAMLNKLVICPEDFVAALKELPANLLTMFVNAYQSYLFNKILSRRIENKVPLNKAVTGDIILVYRNGIIEEKTIKVNSDNIQKVNRQISKGNAFVSGILYGSDSEFSDGAMGKIEHEIISKEKIDPRDFIIPEIPYISSSGTRRPILAPVRNLEFKLNKKSTSLNLKFDLLKGSYATSLLREFMKADNIRNY